MFRKFYSHTLFLLLILSVCTTTAEAKSKSNLEFSQLPETSKYVPNFALVSPSLVRGGQPSRDGLVRLRNSGVRTVVSLRKGAQVKEEEKIVKNLGMNFVSIPMSHIERPAEKQIRKFLDVVEDHSSLPAFIHCHQGQDRTGFMVAIYRMQHDGWPASRAYFEMLQYGFHPFFYHLTERVYDYGAELGNPEPKPGAGHVLDYLQYKIDTLSSRRRP